MQPQQPYGPPPQSGGQYPQQQPLPGPNMGGSQPNPDYGFIMEPLKPQRAPLFKFGGGSPMLRIALVAGGIFLLLILFIGFKNLLGSSNKSIPSMINVAQDQQALVHLATNGAQNAQSDSLKNFAFNAQLSFTSEQKDTVAYLKKNGHKATAKELNLKVNKTLDSRLAAALSTNSYDSTFKQAMHDKLTSYQQALKQAYVQTKGPKGQALLNADYDAAGLLLKQLGS